MAKSTIISIFILVSLISTGLILYLSPKVVPYKADSAMYIDAARHLREGKGLVTQPYGVEPVDVDLAPLKLWPAGYPLLIYILSVFGFSESSAALLIPAVCFILLPFVFYFVGKHLIGKNAAVPAAIISTFLFPNLHFSLRALSDVPFLFASLLSLGMLFASINKYKFQLGLIAGITTGYACGIRNVGYSLVFSVVAGLTLAYLLKLLIQRKYLRILSSFIIGFTVSYTPFILRNILVFHSVQPYSMGPSELSFFDNIKYFVWALKSSLFGRFYYYHYTEIILLILCIVFFGTIVYLLRGKKYSIQKDANPDRITYIIITILYLVFGTLIILISRTKYGWGEVINSRHLMQYNWIFIVYFSGVVHVLYKKISTHSQFRAKLYIALIILGFLSLQFFPMRSYVRSWTGPFNMDLFAKIKRMEQYVANLPKDTFVVSNMSPYFRILTKRSVRQLENTISFKELGDKVSQSHNLVVILINTKKFNRPDERREWKQAFDGVVPQGYTLLLQNDDATVLSYPYQSEEGWIKRRI